jgi:hypothetical protein
MKLYRCPDCREFCDPIREGYDLVSYCHDAVCETVWMCIACEEREQHCGDDHCIQCIADQFVAAPQDFIGTAALKAEIADELAKRLRLLKVAA